MGRSSAAPLRQLADVLTRIVLQVVGNRHIGLAVGVGLGRFGDGLQGEDAGPDRERVVGLVVNGAASADLGTDFLQFEGEDDGGLHLLLVRPADFCPTAFDDMLGEDTKCFHFFAGVIDQASGAKNNDRTIVDGVMEGGTGEDEAVHMRDGDTDRDPAAESFEHAAGGAAVGLLLLLPFHMMRGMGAGDVKLMAGAGALLGSAGAALFAGGATLIAGGVLALAYVAARRAKIWKSTRHDAGDIVGGVLKAGTETFPYALAILAGTLLTLLAAPPWAAVPGVR